MSESRIDNPYIFDASQHGGFADDDLGLYSSDEAYGMGVSAGWRYVKDRVIESQHPENCESCGHRSDCALHSEPAIPRDFCNCGKFPPINLGPLDD